MIPHALISSKQRQPPRRTLPELRIQIVDRVLAASHNAQKWHETQYSPIFARCLTPSLCFLIYSPAAAPKIHGIRFESRFAAARSERIGPGRSGNAGLASAESGARVACTDECRGVDEHGAPRRAAVIHVRDPRIESGGREHVRGLGRMDDRTLPASGTAFVAASEPVLKIIRRSPCKSV